MKTPTRSSRSPQTGTPNDQREPTDGALRSLVPGTLETVGKYKLLRELGSGYLSTVYLAESTTQSIQRVALKLLKPGLNERDFLARFESVRQGILELDHPNILRVFEVGGTESGRVYVTMELARGVGIARFCKEHVLTLDEKLNLFVPVCDAVQQAHYKGVVHGDLKSSNVLVIDDADSIITKLIDFGITRALAPQLPLMSMLDDCDTAQSMAFVSPEFLRSPTQTPDTRSDVYSLGSLLYEMITGESPLPASLAKSSDTRAITQAICETTVMPPSERLTERVNALELSVEQRKHWAKYIKRVRGGLDAIVLKAMEKDLSSRYSTVSAFADDLVKFLGNQQTSTRTIKASAASNGKTSVPSSASMTLGIGKRTVGLIAVSSLVVGGALGALGYHLWQTSVSDSQNIAIVRQPQLSNAPSIPIDSSDATILAEGNEQSPSSVSVSETVIRTLDTTESSLNEAALMAPATGDTIPISNIATPEFESLNVAAPAAPASTDSEADRSSRLIALERLKAKATMYRERGSNTQAVELLGELLDQQIDLLGRDHANVMATLDSLIELNRTLNDREHLLGNLETLLSIQREVNGIEHASTLETLSTLAFELHCAGRAELSTRLYEELKNTEAFKSEFAIVRKRYEESLKMLGPNHSDTQSALLDVAKTFGRSGQFAKAERALTKWIEASASLSEPNEALKNVANQESAEVQKMLSQVREALQH